MLRALLYFQILWVVIAGLMFRGVLPYPDGRITDLLLIGAFLVFPTGIGIAAFRSNISSGRRCGVMLIEAGVTIAYFIAILPGVQ